MRNYKMVRRGRTRGGSKFTQNVKKWMGKALGMLKRSGLVGKLAGRYSKGPIGDVGVDVIKQMGYGKRRVVMRRRRMYGASLAPVGGMIMTGRGCCGGAVGRRSYGRR